MNTVNVEFYGGPAHGWTRTVKTDERGMPPVHLNVVVPDADPVPVLTRHLTPWSPPPTVVIYSSVRHSSGRWAYATTEWLAAHRGD